MLVVAVLCFEGFVARVAMNVCVAHAGKAPSHPEALRALDWALDRMVRRSVKRRLTRHAVVVAAEELLRGFHSVKVVVLVDTHRVMSVFSPPL